MVECKKDTKVALFEMNYIGVVVIFFKLHTGVSVTQIAGQVRVDFMSTLNKHPPVITH